MEYIPAKVVDEIAINMLNLYYNMCPCDSTHFFSIYQQLMSDSLSFYYQFINYECVPAACVQTFLPSGLTIDMERVWFVPKDTLVENFKVTMLVALGTEVVWKISARKTSKSQCCLLWALR